MAESDADSAFIEPAPTEEMDENVQAAEADVTSDYDPSSRSAFTSVDTAIAEHTYILGRRYHKYRDGRYPVPNDETEQEREELKHHMLFELLERRLFLAPIEHPMRIADLGTGTGTWAIDMGCMFPAAHVIGTDLSPIQPPWIPTNVQFVVDDIEDPEWVLGDNFDFIHLRHVIGFLRHPARLAATCLENLKPGGYIELVQFRPGVFSDDGTIPPDYPLHRFFDLLTRALASFYGMDAPDPATFPSLLDSAGYSAPASRKTYKVPIGPWARDKRRRLVGLYMQKQMLDFFPSVGARPLRSLGMADDEVDALVDECKRAVTDMTVHAYMSLHFVWARKPLAESGAASTVTAAPDSP